MIAWKYKHWRTLGAAAAFGLSAGLAACGGEGGENHGGGEGGEGEGGETAVSAPPPSAATATGGGGEAGEAGAATAYAGLSGDQQTALRLAHLKGFVMAADQVAGANASQDAVDAAAVLVQQGLLEVYDVAPDQFGSLNVDLVRAVAEPGVTSAQFRQRLSAAEAELERASGGLDADAAVTVVRMVDIATGLYQGVVQPDFVDPIEYQHSMGAALAARAALQDAQSALRRRDGGAYRDAQTELNAFVALWPQTAAPETPTPYRDVLAHSSRVRLALSPYL